jgi:hypothetical protein
MSAPTEPIGLPLEPPGGWARWIIGVDMQHRRAAQLATEAPIVREPAEPRPIIEKVVATRRRRNIKRKR